MRPVRCRDLHGPVSYCNSTCVDISSEPHRDEGKACSISPSAWSCEQRRRAGGVASAHGEQAHEFVGEGVEKAPPPDSPSPQRSRTLWRRYF